MDIVRALRELPLDASDVTAWKLNASRHDPEHAFITEICVPSCEGPDLRIHVADMRKQLQRTCANSPRFCSIVERALRRCPNGPTQKWGIVMYCDEITPGNILAPMLERKSMNVYYSFKEFGNQLLSQRAMWFTLATVRVRTIQCVDGGWSTVLASILRQTFCCALSPSSAGVALMLPSGPRTVFLALRHILADLDAHRQTLDLKGAKGLKPCPLFCPCVVAKGDTLTSQDRRLVDITCGERARFGTTSSEDVYRVYDVVLEAKRRYRDGNLTKARYEAVEKSSGFNANPHGVMAATDLRGIFSPCAMVSIDPMHVLWSNGIINEEVSLFMNSCPLTWAEWARLANVEWQWPGFLSSSQKSRVTRALSEHCLTKNEGDKYFASDMLMIYPLVRHFAELYFERHRPDDASFVSLARACELADYVKYAKYNGVDAAKRDALVAGHLVAFIAAYGSVAVRPKHHFAFHMGNLDCFTTEAKHSTLKSLANNIKNTRDYERSLSTVAQADQERALEEVADGEGLIGPTATWEGHVVADMAVIAACKFFTNDIVCCGEVLA